LNAASKSQLDVKEIVDEEEGDDTKSQKSKRADEETAK